MDTGLIIDLETTGTDPEKDKIIEIGIVEFAVEEGKPPMITNIYSSLEDPGVPLEDEIKKITGLDDPWLAGQRINWELVRRWFSKASMAIAHNAAFDRSFLLRREELAPLAIHWACSMRHINWQEHGFRNRSLNYLAADHGFVNPFAHRAVFDCAATFRLISPYLNELIHNSYQKEFAVFATGAPFEVKDLLRQRQYRWDAERRVWHKTVMEKDLQAERDFLAGEIYSGTDLHEEQEVDWQRE